jgi:hypothetical protein
MGDWVRGIRLVYWIAATCGLALGVIIVYGEMRGWTPSAVERTINRSLPPGSTRSEIEAFLDAQGWTYVYMPRAIDIRTAFHRQYYEEVDRTHHVTGRIWATIPDAEANVGLLERGWINVDFYLDDQGRLVRSYVITQIISL